MSEILRPYTGYRGSRHPWLGTVPSHWAENRAKFYFREIDERSRDGTEELLSVSHLTGVTPRREKNVTMFKAASYAGHKLCQPGDLVINTMWAWMGALGVASTAGIVSPSYGVYRPVRAGEFHPEYLDHLLRTRQYVSEYICRSTGIRASRLRLYPDRFLDIPVLCPPRKEQDRIAAYLRTSDVRFRRLIRAKQRLVALLSEQKQAIVQRAVTRGIDPDTCLKPSGVEWLGKVPEQWEVRRLKYVTRVNPTRTEGRTVSPDSFATFLPMEAVGPWGQLDRRQRIAVDDDTKGLTYMRDGDVIIAKITPCFENGKGALCSDLENGIAFGSTEFHVLRPMDEMDGVYLYFLTRSPAFRRLGTESMRGSAGQQRVPTDFVSNLVVPVPPRHQQGEIVRRIQQDLENLDASIMRIQQEIGLVREYRARLIADVVTGKLDVRNVPLPDSEPEDGYEWQELPDPSVDEPFADDDLLASGAEADG